MTTIKYWGPTPHPYLLFRLIVRCGVASDDGGGASAVNTGSKDPQLAQAEILSREFVKKPSEIWK